MGGWAACATAAQILSPWVGKALDAAGLSKGEMNQAAFWAWQGVDVMLAFGVAGLAGQFFGSKVRNTVLLGGMLRVVWHIGDRYLPAAAKKYVIEDGGPMGDWITTADVGRLPAPSALGDYITRANVPQVAY
jgi:hypothetical protein